MCSNWAKADRHVLVFKNCYIRESYRLFENRWFNTQVEQDLSLFSMACFVMQISQK